MSDAKGKPRPDLIVIPRRAGRLPKGIVAPLAALVVAGVGLAVRVAMPDWRGLVQEARRGVASLAASRPSPKRPTRTAAASKPQAQPTPGRADAQVASAAKPSEAWDDIRRAAEKVKADQAEAERIKAEADKRIAAAPLPPPRRGPMGRNPAAIAGMRRRQEAAIRQMQAQMARHQDEFDRMVRERMQAQRRLLEDLAMARGGFGGPPPGFERFALPLPGLDRMFGPLPGQPRAE